MDVLVSTFANQNAKDFSSALAGGIKVLDWNLEQTHVFSAMRQGGANMIVEAVAGSGKTTTLAQGILRLPAGRREVGTSHSFGRNLLGWRGKADKDREFWRAMDAIRTNEAKCPEAWYFWALRQDKQGKVCAFPGAAEVVAFATSWVKNTNPLFPAGEEGREVFVQAVWRGIGSLAKSLPEGDEETLVRFLGSCAMFSVAQGIKLFQSGKETSISFDDMLFLPVRLGIEPNLANRFDLVVIDEAQDLNRAQILLLAKFKKPSGSIAGVGDTRQGIYGWRGADTQALVRMQEEWEAVRSGLSVSFRCPLCVEPLAQIFNPEFRVNQNNSKGEYTPMATEADMRGLAGAGDFVLSRTNAPLVREALQFLKVGKAAFVKNQGTLLVDLQKMAKDLGSEALPMEETVARIETWQATQEGILKGRRMAPQQREQMLSLLEDKAQILIAIAEASRDHADMLRRLEVLFAPQKNATEFLTFHGSKGRESQTVWILAEKWTKSLEETEEKNLRYVALTRTQARLYCVGFAVTAPEGAGADQEQAEGEEGETPSDPAPAGVLAGAGDELEVPIPCSAWLPKKTAKA